MTTLFSNGPATKLVSNHEGLCTMTSHDDDVPPTYWLPALLHAGRHAPGSAAVSLNRSL